MRALIGTDSGYDMKTISEMLTEQIDNTQEFVCVEYPCLLYLLFPSFAIATKTRIPGNKVLYRLVRPVEYKFGNISQFRVM